MGSKNKFAFFLLLAMAAVYPAIGASSASGPVKITPANFKAKVLRSKLPVLMDVGATWCVPCHLLAPKIEKMASVYSGRLRVAEMDADVNSDRVEKLGIQAFPTLLFFENGKVAKAIVGNVPEKDLRRQIDSFLKSVEKGDSKAAR